MEKINRKPDLPPIDPDDGVALRTYYESLRGQMVGVRSQWDQLYDQLRCFFAPRSFRDDPSQVNAGEREDFEIINETGLLALRVLSSGMLTGMSPPTRPWFEFAVDDPQYADDKEVKEWCEALAKKVREVMLQSNYYDTLLEMYETEGLYGTCAFLIEADTKTVIRCKPYPTGSYYLGVGDDLRVDLCIRVLEMTVRNIVEKFGRENTAPSTLAMYDSNAGGNKETYLPIVHVIHKGNYFGESKKRKMQPWVSTWYEQGSFNPTTGVLRISGFEENPLITARWKTVGENIYGESPAFDILGSTMSLQAWEERLAQGAEKQFNPPMVADASINPSKLTNLPGEFMYVDFKDGKAPLAPAYQVDFKLEFGLKMLERIEGRINEGMFKSVFQLFTDSDRREITAEEIRAKAQERLSVLGPVIERNTGEIHKPSISRIVNIMRRTPGAMPPVPEKLKAQDGGLAFSLKVSFKSILASAAEMVGMNNINQVMTFVGQEAALFQDMPDNFDTDAIAVGYARLANLPAAFIRDVAERDAVRKAKRAAQAQQAAAENAKNLAQAAQVASQTPGGGGQTLLQKTAPQLAGGDEQ
jgi:hypothetical protein